MNIATGSAAETRYLVGLAERLAFLAPEAAADLGQDYERLVAHLLALVRSLEALDRP